MCEPINKLLLQQKGSQAGHYFWQREKYRESLGSLVFAIVKDYGFKAVRFADNYVTYDQDEVEDLQAEIDKDRRMGVAGPTVILSITDEPFEFFLCSPMLRKKARPLLNCPYQEVILQSERHTTKNFQFYFPKIWVDGSRVATYVNNPCGEITDETIEGDNYL